MSAATTPVWDGLIAQMEEHGAEPSALLAVKVGRELAKDDHNLMMILELVVETLCRQVKRLDGRIDGLQRQLDRLAGGRTPQ